MQFFSRTLAGCAACLWCVAAPAAPQVLITEIMYHPSSELTAEEYIELYNAGPTSVNLAGWQLTRGTAFTFPPHTLAPGGYLVVAADLGVFAAKYPGVANAVGGWEGILSNSGERIELVDADGALVDQVAYADEGEWAQRRRGLLDRNHRGWTWYAEHDGLGKSLELINVNMPNEHGQNWASSLTAEGTPGEANSVAAPDIPPLILQVQHAPVVPSSSDPITITALVRDEQPGELFVVLYYRIDAVPQPPFSTLPMADDGLHGDGLAGDGRYGAVLGPFPDDTVVQFYVEAEDESFLRRSWPGPTLPAEDESFPPTQSANALLQVDDDSNNRYQGGQPVYKVIMREAERAELAAIPPSFSDRNSDAQMNATFISLDGSGTELRYLCGIRNRGHGSRGANPPNYRVNFVSDRPWKDVSALVLNTRSVHAQHLGAVLAQKAGIAGAASRAVQVRINNANLARSEAPMFGSYAANEAMNGDWAERQYPNDGGGNIYKVIRDIRPPNFDYRGEDPNAYRNTYFKQSNTSEDDWEDIIRMLEVMGENSTDAFTEANVRRVIDPEQWLRHMAVMALFANNESGLNTGNNDDYYMYRGVKDPRFVLVYHDLDSILGQNSLSSGSDIFRGTCCPISGDSEGSWRAMSRFMLSPQFRPLYYRIMQDLLDTTFSAAQFDPLVDQTLGDYVAGGTIQNIKNWMNDRRNYVQGQIAPWVQVSTAPPRAVITGEPRSPTPSRNATLLVSGERVTHYRYRLNNGQYSSDFPVGTPITLTGLALGSTNRVSVIGRNAPGIWQSTTNETVSRVLVVNGSWPAVRINEVAARNVAGFNHEGTFPDFIELYNEGAAPVDLTGLQLSDDINQPSKFVFPGGLLATGEYLVLYANAPDGTSGLHTGFSLDQDGEGVFLFDAASRGGGLLDSAVFGQQIADHSIGRNGDRGDLALGPFTPGTSNTIQALGNPASLVINEWLAANGPGYPEDFIELHNPAALPIAVGGLFLTDAPIGFPYRHRIADVSFVAPGGWMAFHSGLNASRPQALGFNLSAEHGQLALLTPVGTVLNCVSYGPQHPDTSTGRCGDGAATVRRLSVPSPNSANQCVTGGPGTGQVVINEVLANNATQQSADGRTPDWLELYNPASTPVNLTGFSLSDRLDTPQRWVFPAGSVIPADGFLSVRFDGDLPASTTNTGFGLSATGDVLYLFEPAGAGGEVLDSIRFGLQPADFSIGRVPDGSANWLLNVPTIGSDNLAATLGNASLVRINEWMAAPASGDDWFELFNPNPQPVDIGGFALTDELAVPDKRVLPALSYLGAVTNAWQRFHADDNAEAGADHMNFRLNATEDVIAFFSAGGALVDVVSVVDQSSGVSEGRLPDGEPVLASFAGSASPGQRNYAHSDRIVINEVLTHSDPPLEDAIELFNTSGAPLDIGGWWLSDSSSVPQKFQIPSNTILEPGGFAVFYEASFNNGDIAPIPFALSSANGDQVFLWAVDESGALTGFRAEAEFGPAENAVSFGRHVTSIGADFVAMSARSFGVDNPVDLAQFRAGTGASNPPPRIGPVVMTEIMFQPPLLGGVDNVRDEFVELHNPGSVNLPLYDPAHPANTWRLRKGIDFDFPPGVSLTAGGSLLVVSFDPQNDPAARAAFEAVYGAGLVLFGPYTGKLDNDGEPVELLKPDPPQAVPGPDFGKVPYVVVERIQYAPGSPWPGGAAGTGLSLQRTSPNAYGNEPLHWFTALPTPGPAGLTDSDGDGMPDDWESAHDLDPNSSADANQDTDQDGFTNRQEYDAGTDPRDGESYLRILSARLLGGAVRITFEAAADRSYSIYYSPDLPGATWDKLMSVPAEPLARLVEVSDSTGGPQRYYRLGAP